MKRILTLLLLLTLTGCAAPEPEAQAIPALAPTVAADRPAALGIAASAHLSHSMHATADFPGYAHLEVTVAAVVVDSGGVIRQCAIDGVSARLCFDCTGTLLPGQDLFPSKASLGQSYGMHKASPLGTEWQHQAADFAQSCVGKTVEELRGGADTVTSVTIDTSGLLQAVTEAAENARPTQGLWSGDRLALTCRAAAAPGRSAAGDNCGRVSLRFCAAARALRGDTSTAEAHTALAAHVLFDGAGRILSDVSAALRTGSPTLYPTGVTAEQMALLRDLEQEN